MKNFLLIGTFVLASIASVKAQSFLDDWEGDYKGQMIVGLTNRPNDSVNVSFELKPIQADSVWMYKMVFDSEKFGRVVKDYEIRRVGDSSSDFLLDEKDGILIEMSLMNGCFYDLFEVMGSILSSTLCKNGDDLRFDLFMSSKKNGTVTTSEEDEEGEVFEVTSYKPTLHQTVVLKRVSTN